jgi:Spy/CpxP family protein refolding chaperone
VRQFAAAAQSEETMKSQVKSMTVRLAAVLLFGAVVMTTAAMAQSDAPPPPPQGQQGPPPGGRRGGMDPEKRLEHLQKGLKLSDDQTAQVKAVFEDGRSKMEALRSNTALAPQDRRTQGEALRQQEEAKLEAILTPAQKTKYEEMRAKQQERMQEHRGGRGGAGAPPPPPAM